MILSTDEVEPLKTTCCVRPSRNDVSHESTVPENPKETSAHCRRMEWSTVSNAADISSSPKRVTPRRSAAAKTSDRTFSVAVSVECRDRNPDCSFGRSPDSLRNPVSCWHTILSTSLEMYVRFEIGR